MKKATNETILAVLGAKVDEVKSEVNEIKFKLDSHYVTQDQFDPVKKVVYGLISVILFAVVGALVGLVLIK